MNTTQRRYQAAHDQRWSCWICGTLMADQRACSGADEEPCDAHRHIPLKRSMPRFRLSPIEHRPVGVDCDAYHYGNPHASTYIDEQGLIRAVHISCGVAVNSMVQAHHQTPQSAIHRLRDRAGKSATHELHGHPVDNQETAQLERATNAPTEAQPPSDTTTTTHSVETPQSLETQVEAGLARVENRADQIVAAMLATAPPLTAHQATELRRFLG